MKLADYVKKRNGVPLGADKSLRNMMTRSLGSGTFSGFWKFWNPIWGYYLGKLVFKPLKNILPVSFSIILTFLFCGFLHDVAIMLFKWKFTLVLTPWFLLMGICVVISDFIKLDYSNFPWIARAFINILIIGSCLLIANQLRI